MYCWENVNIRIRVSIWTQQKNCWKEACLSQPIKISRMCCAQKQLSRKKYDNLRRKMKLCWSPWRICIKYLNYYVIPHSHQNWKNLTDSIPWKPAAIQPVLACPLLRFWQSAWVEISARTTLMKSCILQSHLQIEKALMSVTHLTNIRAYVV